MKYDKEGRELPDDTPVEVPLRFRQVAGNGDILQSMLQRLREEQEKEIAETAGEVLGEGEEPEMFDLPTKYELDHDAEERALLYAENAERIRQRELARGKKEKRYGEGYGEGSEGGRGEEEIGSRRSRGGRSGSKRAALGAGEEGESGEDSSGASGDSEGEGRR